MGLKNADRPMFSPGRREDPLPEDRSILIKTAYAYYQRGDWDRALEEYHKLVDIDPGDLNVLNILADIYAKKGDVKEALRQYDLVAQGYDQKNQVDKVLQVYKRMIKLSPSDLELQTAVRNLVQKYLDRAAQLEESDPDRVIEIYRSILKAEPNRFDATTRMAKALVKKQQKFQAVELLLNMAEALDPDTQAGRLLDSLQMVVEIDPVNVEAREKLSKLLMAAHEPVQAIENLRALMEIYISRNDLEHARETTQRAIDFGDVEAYYHLGVIHFNQERFGESLQCFRRFLQKQETHVGALKYLALCHLKLNQHAEAVQAYLRILSVYVNENLLDEAREVRQTILELDPSNEAVKSITLDPVVEPQPPQAPVEVAPPAVPAAPAPVAPEEPALTTEKEQQAFLEHAQGFVEKGLYDQAIDLYLEMIKRWPSWNEIKVRLQQVYALMVKPAEPAVKGPSPEQMKTELEHELREQMKSELEAQARRMSEEQARMQAERLEEIQRIKRDQEEERKNLQKELEEKMLEQMRKSRAQDEQRDQLQHEFEERQKSLSQEWEKFEREKEESALKLRQDMEKSQKELEGRLRDQVEREFREKLEKEAAEKEQREREQRERDEKVKALMKQEDDERRRYEEEKNQKKAEDSLQNEIFSRMERLRGEKEKEPVPPPIAPKSSATAVPPEGAPVSTPSEVLQEVNKPITAPSSSAANELALNDPFVRQTLADIYAKQGLFVEAVKIYEKILNEDPNNDEVREKLRDILRMKGF